jgi:MFS family permease
MAQFLQTGLHYGPLTAGLGLMPWGATTFIVPQLAGALINRLGERPFIVLGMCLHAAAMTWIALITGPSVNYPEMIAPLILSGVGVAMAAPATQSAVLSSVAPQYLGKASGAYSTMRQLGGAFGVAIVVAAFATTGSYVSTETFSNGFVAAMSTSAALSLVGALTGLAARRRVAAERRHQISPTESPSLDSPTSSVSVNEEYTMSGSAAMEIVPGLWRIPTLGRSAINSFAFVDPDGSVTLVDCGLARAQARIVAGLAAIGKHVSDRQPHRAHPRAHRPR